MSALTVNPQTAAKLAFHLRDQPVEVAAKVLTDLVPELYRFARRTHSPDAACRFVFAFMTRVFEAMREPSEEIH
jgi:hypothetical protein